MKQIRLNIERVYKSSVITLNKNYLNEEYCNYVLLDHYKEFYL